MSLQHVLPSLKSEVYLQGIQAARLIPEAGHIQLEHTAAGRPHLQDLLHDAAEEPPQAKTTFQRSMKGLASVSQCSPLAG